MTFMTASWLRAECPHGVGQEPGMQRRERCVRNQDSGERRRRKMSPMTRPGSRQLFPPGSGCEVIWINLCWGWGVTQVMSEVSWEMSTAATPRSSVMGDAVSLIACIVCTAAPPRPWRPWVPASHHPECLLSLSHSWHHTGADHDAPRSWFDITH